MPTVVCLGASAGGLEALHEFFEAYEGVSCGDKAAFVVVVHLSPDFKSLMPELLSKRTSMPVLTAEDDTPILPNHVFVLPPGSNVLMEDGRLTLKAQDRRPGHSLNLPIDLFMASMAADRDGDCVGIILSGTGSDGSRGIRAVKEAGGVVLAQNPTSAKFDGMPISARQTGMVDAVGTPADIAQRVGQLLDHQEMTPVAHSTADDSLFRELFEILARDGGIDLSYMRLSMVQRRVFRRMTVIGHKSLGGYLKTLVLDPVERTHLSNDLLIGVTHFYRDPAAFDALAESIIPQILHNLAPQEQVRVWVAACSTGQEVYTLAMLLHEIMGEMGAPRELRLFATDVSEAALMTASRGIYSLSDVADLPAAWVAKYMDQHGDSFVVSQAIRRSVIFARHNVVSDPPFTRMDLVTCRNLLIYLRPDVQQRVLGAIYLSLKPQHGYLMLGSAEDVGNLEKSLISVAKGAKIFLRQGQKPSYLQGLPLLQEPISIIRASPGPVQMTHPPSREQSRDRIIRSALETLAEVEARSVAIVEVPHRLVEVVTDPARLFSLPKGTPTNDLSRMLPSAVTSGLAAGHLQLNEGKKQVHLLIPTAEGIEYELAMRNLPGRTGEVQYRLLVIQSRSRSRREDAPTPVTVEVTTRVEELEHELRETKESLQATIEELQSSNEEQQSTNEELVASNEELQSTNEELHSVNEELFTVNTEYRHRNDELAMVTADLDNLLRSIDVAILYLDSKRRIRRFTPSTVRLLPLQDSDIDRPITDINHGLEVNFAQVAADVEHSGELFEKEIRGSQGSWLLLRVIPYRGPTGQTQGSLITLVDVTRIKNAEESASVMSQQLQESNAKLTGQAQQLEDYFSIVAHDMKRPILGLDGMLSLARTNIKKTEFEKAEKFVDKAFTSLESLRTLLSDLTSLSVQATGDLALETVSVSEWLEELLIPYRARAEEEGVQIRCAVTGDKGSFSRAAAAGIVVNLVENAFIHGTSGLEPRIDVIGQVEQDLVRITVADNGRGIPPHQHNKVFELFRRLNPRETEGSGVGLVAARRLAEKAGGKVSLYSKEGNGAQFVVELPNSTGVEGVKNREAGESSSPPSILLIEDDRTESRYIRGVLKNYVVYSAYSMGEAQELLENFEYDLVVLDLSLPDGHGLKLLTQSSTWCIPNTPVMILSSKIEGIPEGIKQSPLVFATLAKNEDVHHTIRVEVDKKLGNRR